MWRPQQDSNLRTRFRRGLLCIPLSCGDLLGCDLPGHGPGTASLTGAAGQSARGAVVSLGRDQVACGPEPSSASALG